MPWEDEISFSTQSHDYWILYVLVFPRNATEAASLRRLSVFRGVWDKTQASKAKPKRGYNIFSLSDLLEMKHGSMYLDFCWWLNRART